MTISIVIFLYLYYGLLVVWVLFSLVAIYHMLKFGFKNFTTFFTTFCYMAISFIILTSSFNYISQVDWNGNLSILQLFNQANPFSN